MKTTLMRAPRRRPRACARRSSPTSRGRPRPRGRAPRARARSAGSASSSAIASRRAAGVARRDQPPGAVLLDHLAEAAHVGEHHRLAEGEAREQHAGDVDLAVGEHEQVGAPEVGGQLRVGDVARHEADVGRSVERLGRHAERAPHDPQLRARDARGTPRPARRPPCTAHDAEAQHHRPLDGRELGRERPLVGLAREVLEGAVGDHVHPRAAAEQLGAVPGVHDHGVHALGEPAPGAARGGCTLCIVSTCGRSRGSSRAVTASSQSHCQCWRSARAGAAAQSQRVGHVLGELEGPPQARPARPPGRWRAGRRTRSPRSRRAAGRGRARSAR